MRVGHAALWVGGGVLVSGAVYVATKISELATGDGYMDRYSIRGNVLFYSVIYRVNAYVVMAIIHNESAGNPANYVGDTDSKHGPSIGPMQVSRDTAKALGLWTPPPGLDERGAYQELAQDERMGIKMGCAVLANKLTAAGGDYPTALRMYNGSGAAAEAYREKALAFLGDTFPQNPINGTPDTGDGSASA